MILDRPIFFRTILLFAGFSFGFSAFAAKSTGRIVIGATAVTERYTTSEFGSSSNDALVASARYFYKVSDIGEDKWETILDFRDKNDFFGKLNKEQLQLESKNEFQVRQLTARWVNPQGALSAQVGRFQVFESGSTYLDGAAGEFRFNPEWKTGLLAGLNPKSLEKSYLEYNANAGQSGAYLTYQSRDRDWNENQYLTLAMVNQTYYSKTERSFLFNNFVYQWNADSRVINTLYYDFVPSAKVQTLNFLYQQRITNRLTSELGALHLDVVEYKRVQNLLEKLPSSPYDETRLQFEYKVSDDNNLGIEFLSGRRKFDLLTKEEVVLGYDFNNLFSRSFDLRTQAGYRKNFTSKDSFFRLNMGYYSSNWEIYLDNQIGQNKNDDGTKTNPLITDLGVTNYFSKQLYLNFSVQRAAQEGVNIIATFFRIGYRFGNQEIPPVRDGAPPRGAL